MSERRFERRVAIITGGAGGMGVALARTFADGGARLVLVDVQQEHLDGAAAQLALDSRPLTLAIDITSASAPDEIVDAALAAYGQIDILVNNAGITRAARAESISAQDWDDVMDVNLRAPFLLSQAVGRRLLDAGRPGVIVNIGSIGGRTASPQNIPYGVSKAAVLGLTQQLAVEWGPFDIRVNAVNPGLTTWHMRALEPDEDVKRRQAEIVPLRRLAEPADIAAAVAFLASDDARCITGAMLDVDGGFLLSVMTTFPRSQRREHQP